MAESGQYIFAEKDKTDRPQSMVDMHEHDCHELYLLISGRRRYFIEHTIYDLVPGNVMVIPKGEYHRTTAIGNVGYDRYVVYFYENHVKALLGNIGTQRFDEFLKCKCLKLPGEIVRQIRERIELLLKEQEKKDRYSEAFAQIVLQEILLLLMRHGEKKTVVSGGSAEKIQEAAQYISENYSGEITLHTVAQLVYMEDTYFSKQFKALTGIGFHEYLVKTRLKAAEQLLETTDLPVGEVALRCGFSAGNYFGDVFKAAKGVSPSQFRKSKRADR